MASRAWRPSAREVPWLGPKMVDNKCGIAPPRDNLAMICGHAKGIADPINKLPKVIELLFVECGKTLLNRVMQTRSGPKKYAL